MTYGSDSVGSDSRFLASIEPGGQVSGLYALTQLGSSYRRLDGEWVLNPPKIPLVADDVTFRFVEEGFVTVFDLVSELGIDPTLVIDKYAMPSDTPAPAHGGSASPLMRGDLVPADTQLLGAVVRDGVTVVGLYAHTTQHFQVRRNGYWEVATGASLNKVHAAQMVEVRPSFVDKFDALEAEGSWPTIHHVIEWSTSGGPASWDTQQSPSRPIVMKPHQGVPAAWESKVRGLLLGIALGDGLGSTSSGDAKAILRAGTASQLAAWTANGMLRANTRYGGVYAPYVPMMLAETYQRWAIARRVAGWSDLATANPWLLDYRGWLEDVPVSYNRQGNESSIERAIVSGVPSGRDTCRALIKALPLAAYAGAGQADRSKAPPTLEEVAEIAATVTRTTHSNAKAIDATSFGTRLVARCLQQEVGLREAIQRALLEDLPSDDSLRQLVLRVSDTPRSAPTLREIAPDDSAGAVLAGGIYVAWSFAEVDGALEAIEFARNAPDPDGVAAMTGALIGAAYGYEAFPTEVLGRLELGWTIDRLAIDLGWELKHHVAPLGGWKEAGGPLREPWWDAKYPGT